MASLNRRWLWASIVWPASIWALLGTGQARASEKNGYSVNGFVGSFSTGVSIAVPPYHGIEPRLGLSYSSEGRNGIVGVGWNLTGFSQILGNDEMAVNPGSGWPTLLYLDGQPLLACPSGSSYPSCASGGTHYTRNESYLKIVKTDEDHWTVYGKDGTQTKFTSLGVAGDYAWKLGQSQTIDTHGNTVTYTWWNPDGAVGNLYPSTATYNGYTVELLYETRPDPISMPVRYGANIRTMNRRLKTVKVRLSSGALIRAYKLTYTTAPQSGKSLLASVQQFGKDASFDGSGTITGGLSLPAQTFSYQADGSAATLGGDVQVSTAGPPPTAPGTVEDVVWTSLNNTIANGNSLVSLVNADPEYPNWKTGIATRALSAGSGYVEATFWPSANSRSLWLGQVMAYLYPYNTGVSLYTPETGYVGPYAVSGGQTIRVAVSPTNAQLKVNGSTVVTVSRTTVYPVGVAAYIWGDNETLHSLKLSGALVNSASVDCGSTPRFPGDFNGDGRQDFVCRNPGSGALIVTLATATGFADPVIWASTSSTEIRAGDFTGDGKADVLGFDQGNPNYYYVYPSTGTGLGSRQNWGQVQGVHPFYGTNVWCKYSYAHLGPVGDFDGDGKADIACVGDSGYAISTPGILVSYSTGSGFFGVHVDACGTSASAMRLDWNGDGRDDLLCTSGDPNNSYVYGNRPDYGFVALANRDSAFCSNGDYWSGDVNGDGRADVGCKYGNVLLGGATTNLANQGSFCVSGQVLIQDLDGDGAAEWICNNPGNGADDIQVRKWTGAGFGAATTWRGGFCAGTVTAGDYNGDGKTDLICESTGLVAYAGSKGMVGDLVTQVANGIGASTTLTYAPSTNFSSLNGASPRYAVTSVTQNDGRGGQDVTSYAYENSYQDAKDLKWIGFAKVTTTLPKLATEASPPVIITGYNVTHGPSEGSVDWVERRDGANRLLSYTKNTYATSDTGNRTTSLLSMVESESYDGTTTARCTNWQACPNGRRTKSVFSYDNYGNQTQAINHGDLEVSGDETTTATSYAVNTSAYIVGLPGRSQTFAGIDTLGTLLTESQVWRDGNTAWNTAPTKGDATTSKSWLNTESRFVSSTTAFDTYGNATSSTDPTGKTVSATYDTTYHVFPVTATNAASESTSTSWDYLCASPATTTDPNGQVTTLTYDALCRPTGATAPLGAFETRSYLGLGDPNTQCARVETPGPDGNNDWAESYFDGWGRTYRTIKRGPSTTKSIVTDLQFDQRGNVSAQTAPYYADETPVVTTFEYDAFNRQVKTTLPDANTRITSYPALSGEGLFQTTQTNELGQSSTTKFDVFGRVRRTEKNTSLHGNLVTVRNYDILGRMTSLQDPAGNTWTYTFDSLGRNLSKNDPDAGNWTFAYDDAGRLITQTDAKSQTTTLEYDNVGRPQFKKIRPTGGATGTVTEYVETTYGTSAAAFNKGRVTQVVTKNGAGAEQNGKLAFEYDALGRVTKQTRTLDGTNYAVERNYDTAGYLRGMRYPDNDIIGLFGGTGTALGYDEAGRLSTIPGILSSVTYNAVGAPLVQTNANGTTTTKTYDPDRFWLTDIDTTAPSLTLQNLHYTLNAAGMATAVDSDVANEDWTYAYDELNRLTSAQNGVGANHQTWAYDSLGRFTSNSRVGTTFTYQNGVSTRPHAVTQISGGPLGTLNFTYDANGNMTSGNGRTMTWNAENMITQVVANSNTTTFTYGPDATRIKKAAGATVAKYPFGDDYEVDTSGTVTKYFNAGFGVIAKKVGSALYWLHTDRMGSINATTDSGGAQVLRRSYRSYGELLGQTGTHTESLGYIGQRTDGETANGTTDDKGLTYLHARYYDAALGIYLSPDPAGADSNTYRYSFGDSVNFKDPSGLIPCWGETFRDSDDGTLLDSKTEQPCDEGEASFNEGINQYLHNHNYPAPRKVVFRPPKCADVPSKPGCPTKEPDPPTGPDCSAVPRPADCTNTCTVSGFAATGEGCQDPPPPGCGIVLIPCPNAPGMSPEDQEKTQQAQWELLLAQSSTTCSALFGPDLTSQMSKSTYVRDSSLPLSVQGSWNASDPGTIRLGDLFFQDGMEAVGYPDGSGFLFTSDAARRGSGLGHEHLHQAGRIPSDAKDPLQGARNSQLVSSSCFR